MNGYWLVMGVLNELAIGSAGSLIYGEWTLFSWSETGRSKVQTIGGLAPQKMPVNNIWVV